MPHLEHIPSQGDSSKPHKDRNGAWNILSEIRANNYVAHKFFS